MSDRINIRLGLLPPEQNRIDVSGVDLANCTTAVDVKARGHELPQVTLTLCTPLLLEVMAEVDIKLPDDDRAVELFKAALDNGGSVQDMATTFIKSLLQFGIDQMEGE